jgi:anti-sigma B factor antagonist
LLSTSFDSSGAGSGFVVEQRRHDTTVVLSCSGEIDMATASLLEEALASAQTNQPSAVIVDLSAVDFLASIGMGLLITTQKRLPPGMGFAVVADGPGTSRPLTLIGAADQINMHPTLEAALASTADGAVSS